MATIFPFRALRPRPQLAPKVASVPYDVVSSDEARALAAGNPHSFLHVTKPEIDLAPEVDAHSHEVYRRGASNLRQMIDDGVLVQDDASLFYIYALTWREHTQTGVVCLASVDDYNRNLVRKHEHTRPDKEDDRAHHMEILGAQSGTVFLMHRDSSAVAQVVRTVTAQAPEVAFEANDGVAHQVWVVRDPQHIQALVRAFEENGPLYIADGHHRSAAAARVARQRGGESAGFLAVSFPLSELRILPYNRVVKDLGQHTPSSFRAAIEGAFQVTPGKTSELQRHQFGMFLEGRWYTLRAKEAIIHAGDPVRSLDVSILQDNLLGPILDIQDPRRDQRIDFVGGIRGDGELERRVSGGWAVAFSMHPTAVEELVAIADAGEVMPPKSTWFEPKLRDGLFVHLL